MGNFYVNFLIKGAKPDRIAQELRAARRTAYLTPVVNGCVVVYDRQCDEQDVDAIRDIGAALSKSLNCHLLAILNHDDDVLVYWLWHNGQPVDGYNSSPAFFDESESETPGGGDAAKLCALFSAKGQESQIEAILRTPGGPAVERHAQLATALRWPRCTIGSGFHYIQDGQCPEGIEEDDLELIESPEST